MKNANLNRDVCTFMTMDPYCKLMVGKFENHKTKTCKDGGKNPKWDETFDIKLIEPTEIMEIRVMDDQVGSDEDVGRCQIKLSQLMYGKGVDESFILLWKNKKAGEIFIKSEYNNGQMVA